MRIALFTNQFPATVNTFFSRDLITLLRNGFDVDIYPVYPVKKSNWRNVPVQWRQEINDRVRIYYISPFHGYGVPKAIREDVRNILSQSFSFGVMQWLKSYVAIRQSIRWQKTIRAGQYDYLLSYWGNYAATYAYLCNKLMGANVPFSFYLHAGTDLYRDQIFLKEKILFSRNVFTVCDFNKQFLYQLYPEEFSSFEKKIILHHLGLDLENFEFQKHRKGLILLSVGWFTKVKGFEYVIGALPVILKRFPECILHMIGAGEEKKRLVKLVKSLGIENSVRFLGWIPFEQVRTEMEKAALLIHPSSGLGDAVPTVIKEALALGLPVIGSNVAGIPELLDHGRIGVLIQPQDSRLLADAVISLLENDNRRMSLASSGRKFAEQNFDMWRNGKKLAEKING